MSKNISDQLVEALVDAGIQRIYAAFSDGLTTGRNRFSLYPLHARSK